jgi:hypothetical protein
MAAIGACQKPIITEAVASLTSTDIPYEELTSENSSAYMLQSTIDQTLGHMDQITFKAQVITEPTLQLKPGTTVMITSSIAPAPYVTDGLYNIEDNNLVQIRIKNTHIREIQPSHNWYSRSRTQSGIPRAVTYLGKNPTGVFSEQKNNSGSSQYK